MYSVILLAGGKGTRMKKKTPKQYLLLAGKPIIMHSIERLDKIEKINEIVIVCEDEYVLILKELIAKYNIKTKIVYAKAGINRQMSVFSGLQKITNDDVIIHESARPFVKKEDFERLIECPEENVTFGISIPFTVVKGDEKINSLLNRSELINVQLPQKFEAEKLRLAHDLAIRDKKEFTEDAGMVYTYTNTAVKILQGNHENIKITEGIDLAVGEIIYNEYIKYCRL